jgi:Fe-S cluster assembly protein SufB
MTRPNETIETLLQQDYEHGFVTDIDADTLPPGLNEDTIRAISAKKNEPEFMLAWRLKAYEYWRHLKEPHWAHLKYGPIDYQALSYYSAPKLKEGPKNLDEVDP